MSYQFPPKIISLPAGVVILKSIDLGHTFLYWRSDSVLQFQCGNETVYTPEILKVNSEAAKKITQDQPHLQLVIVGEWCQITNEARSELACKSNSFLSIAEAYVIRGLAQRITATWYLRRDKPVTPTAMFDSQEAAELWLKEVRSKLL